MKKFFTCNFSLVFCGLLLFTTAVQAKLYCHEVRGSVVAQSKIMMLSFLLFTLIVLPFAPNAPIAIVHAQRPVLEAYQERQDAEGQDSEQQMYSSQELYTPEAQLKRQLKARRDAENAGKDKAADHDEEPSSNNDGNRQNDPCREISNQEDKLKKRCFEAAGSSNGVAKGDFNGDGFADLAIGVPGEDITFDNGTTAVDAGAVNIIYGSANGLTSTDTSVPRPQIISQSSPGVPDTSEADDNFGRTLVAGDFDGDGFSDLAVGIPNEDVVVSDPRPFGGQRLVEHAGAFIIIFSDSTGLVSDAFVPSHKARIFDQDSFVDSFIVPGSAPLAFLDPDRCSAGTCFEYEDIHAHDHFGSTMAWGDFNNDDDAELVVGAPDQDAVRRSTTNAIFAPTQFNAGAVYIFNDFLFLSQINPDGLIIKADIIFQEDVKNGVRGIAVDLAESETNDRFGSALVGGKFDGDDFDDLAIGTSGEDDGGLANRGAIYVIYGKSEIGCSGNVGLHFFHARNCAFAPGEAERVRGSTEGLRLGNVLAAGDFDKDGDDDLAAGVPNAIVQGQAGAGAVHIFVSAGSADDFSLSLIITEPSDSLTSTNGGPEAGDNFGAALAAGDFNGDGFKDLAIGAPLEDAVVNGATFIDYGSVQVALGGSSGLPPRPRDFFTPPASALQDDAHLGSSLTAWDFGLNVERVGLTLINTPKADLAVGVPGRNVGTVRNAGEVTVFYGRSNLFGRFVGFNTRVDFWNQSSSGIPGGAETNDRFGEALY